MAGTLAAVLCLAIALPAGAREPRRKSAAKADTTAQTAAAPAKPDTMTIAEAKQILGIVVFPAKGQAKEQQEAEETECLLWGADQAGIRNSAPPDPNQAAAQAKAKTDSATAGAGVRTAAKGAAVGALIGSISGDAGTGAAYGAAAGAVAGRSATKKASAQAEAQAREKAEAEKKAKIDAVKKGMTLCLESKGYTVK
jgi:hypothetical protein